MATFVGKWSRSREAWQRMRPKVKRSRCEATPAEAALWEKRCYRCFAQALSTWRHGRLTALKFRRQHPIAHFFVDFCCPSARWVVEVDGPIHQGREEEDAARQSFLEQRRYRVVRFRNEEVLQDVQAVLERIRLAAAKT